MTNQAQGDEVAGAIDKISGRTSVAVNAFDHPTRLFDDSGASALLGGSGSWLTYHGARTESRPGRSGETMVIIEPSRPQELAWLRASAYGLSERERAVVDLVVQGASTREISRALYISEYTVQEHLSNALTR